MRGSRREDSLIGLLPEDPKEIRRIYRGVLAREGIERTRTADFDLSYFRLARVLDVALVFGGPLFVAPFNQGLDDYMKVLVLYVVVTGITCLGYNLGTAALFARRYGWPQVQKPSPRAFLAIGPLSLAYLVFIFPKRIAPASIDVHSLDVLEPVAREIARPILKRAREQTDSEARESRVHTEELQRLQNRLAELRRDRTSETDPTWRGAIERRIAEVTAQVEDQERVWQERQLARTRIEREARTLEEQLDRLARRRRLLAEIAAERRDHPVERTLDGGIADIQLGLTALTESLRENDAGTARLKAEIEMRES